MSFLLEIADLHAMSFCSTPNPKLGVIFKQSASTSPSATPSVAPSASTSPLLAPITIKTSSSSPSSSSTTPSSRLSEQRSQLQPQQTQPMTTTSSPSHTLYGDHQSLKVPQTTFLGWTPPSSPWMRPSVTDEEHMNKLVSFQL